MSQCPICRLLYNPDSPEDRRCHRKYHDRRVKGLPVAADLINNVIYEEGQNRVIVVSPMDNIQLRHIAQEASLLMAEDLEGFGGVSYCEDELPDKRNLHMFLGLNSTRVVSFLAFERRRHIRKCHWNLPQEVQPQQVTDRAWMWSVGVIWVLKDHRRRGWAKRLIQIASAYLQIPSELFGWYTPFTSSGEAFARSLHPQSFYIAN